MGGRRAVNMMSLCDDIVAGGPAGELSAELDRERVRCCCRRRRKEVKVVDIICYYLYRVNRWIVEIESN